MTETLTTLAAEAAMRHEDLRIARKHEREAEDRVAASDTAANQRALQGARSWTINRATAYRAALREWNRAAEKATRPNMARVRRNLGV